MDFSGLWHKSSKMDYSADYGADYIILKSTDYNPLIALSFERPYLKQSQKLMYDGLWS